MHFRLPHSTQHSESHHFTKARLHLDLLPKSLLAVRSSEWTKGTPTLASCLSSPPNTWYPGHLNPETANTHFLQHRVDITSESSSETAFNPLRIASSNSGPVGRNLDARVLARLCPAPDATTSSLGQFSGSSSTPSTANHPVPHHFFQPIRARTKADALVLMEVKPLPGT